MPRRRRSVPPPAPPSSDLSLEAGGSGSGSGSGSGGKPTSSRPKLRGRPPKDTAATAMPSPSSPPPPIIRPKAAQQPASKPAPAPSASLLSQADALARMTIELNLRAVAGQAERLERDLKALVVATARDKEFRERHEQRLEDMWREILAVKKRMGEFQERSREDVERCQRETAGSMGQLRVEMGQLRGLVDDVSASLDRLPLGEDPFAGTQATQPQDAVLNRRVQEALSSTRRWNRDHKTTPLADAPFIANYLKQQSKRDPSMAVFIQRALQRHIARGRRRRRSQSSGDNHHETSNYSRARPRNLEQFCQDLTWKDVIETVEEALVRDRTGVLRAMM